MIVKSGDELEIGTVTYILGPLTANGYFIVRRPVPDTPKKPIPFIKSIMFSYDPDDELWATYAVRSRWAQFPYRHPRCTLFGILYFHLEITYSASK